MNILDIHTVVFSQLITDTVCVAVLVFLWLQNRKRFTGIFFWMSDLALQTAGILLVILRGQIPDGLSIGFTNPLVVGGAYLGYLGLERFVGKKSNQIYNDGLLIIFVLANSYFAVIQPNLDARAIILSIGLFIICVQCIWLVLRRLEAAERRRTLAIGVVFGIFCLVSVARVVIVLTLPAPNVALFRSDMPDVLVLLIYQVLVILLTFSLMLLVNNFLVSEALGQGEAFIKIFQESVVALSLIDFEKETFIDVNDEWLKMTGFSRDEVIGKDEKIVKVWKNPLDWDRLKHKLKEHGEDHNLEVQRCRKNGDEFTALMTAQTIDLWGKQTLLISSLDITERKKAEQEILDLNGRLQVLIAAVQELAAASDLEAVMAAVRTSARKLTGSDGSTFVLREDDQCYYADEDAISPLWKGQRFPMSACISGWTMLNKQPAVIEDIYADPRVLIDTYKPTFVKSLAMVPIRTHDPLGAIGNYWAQRHQPTEMEVQLVQTLADAAARAMENVRLLEELEQRVRERTAQLETANHELEAFSYSVSHDLRAPLRAMSGFSRILVEEYKAQMPPEATRYLGLIDQNAGQMGELIDDLLRFSRLSRQALNKQPIAMDELVRQVLEELHAEQEGRQVEVKISELPECQADPALLKQVWVNLLSNAFKFTRKCGAAKIEVGYLPHPKFPAAQTGASPDLKKDEVVNVESGAYFVKDNGVGFDMQYVNKLFGVFQRLHRAEDYEGTGVGLAIVQRVIHRHGGRVWAEAEVDKGATFYFTLGGGSDE